MTKTLLGLLFLSLACLASAQTRAKLKPLYFQADKNNLQVLPQRFEFSLPDEDRIKIGNILIDTTQVTFSIEQSSGNNGTYNIHFTWPAGLIKQGELAIKNNSGKAIFNTAFSSENIKVTPNKNQTEDENTNSELATLSVENISPSLIEDMKYFPFMVFCIFRETEGTRLYLCSKELYLSAQDKQLTIKPRSSSARTAQVKINGKIVGNQGMIYLNDREESVAFKVETQTGAFLEIETRMKDVDFKDLVASEDGNNLIITATGAEPVTKEKIKRISNTDWQITLPKSRPMLYLKGDGDIPLRQEFYVRGALPREKNRPYVSPKSISHTYSSTVAITGIAPDGVQIKTPTNDKASSLTALKKNQFTWSIHNIPSGTSSRRYLSVLSEGNEFSVGYDIFRGSSYTFSLGAHYQTPSGIAFGTIEFQWWIEKFLTLNSDWSRFHWCVTFERKQHLTENNDYPKVDINNIELLWRAHEGFYLSDETWGLSLPLQFIQGEGGSAMAYGLGGFWHRKTPEWLTPFMQWSELKLIYILGSSGSDFKVSSAYNLKALAYKPLSQNLFLRYGMDLSAYKYSPSTPKEDMQIGLDVNALWKF